MDLTEHLLNPLLLISREYCRTLFFKKSKLFFQRYTERSNFCLARKEAYFTMSVLYI